MSEPELIKVKYSLTEKVAKPGGMTAELANERARRELAALGGDARKALDASIKRLEGLCAERTATMDAVYEETSTVLDIAGMFDMRILCDASYSLCELTDRLRSGGRQDWASVGVHVNALRLIWTKDKQLGPEMKEMVDGLWALTDRMAPG